MKVKVGDKIYSSDDQPLMVVFEDNDKTNVQNTEEACHKYASAPKGYFSSEQDFLVWMREGLEGIHAHGRIHTFKDKRPVYGQPVWVWDNQLPTWHMATLIITMSPLHLEPREKATWSLLEGEARRALPEDIWCPVVCPLPPHHGQG